MRIYAPCVHLGFNKEFCVTHDHYFEYETDRDCKWVEADRRLRTIVDKREEKDWRDDFIKELMLEVHRLRTDNPKIGDPDWPDRYIVSRKRYEQLMKIEVTARKFISDWPQSPVMNDLRKALDDG